MTMAVAKIIIENKKFDFDVETRRNTEIRVSKHLYDLLELQDENGDYYCTHRSNWNIDNLIDNIENDGLEEYTGITEDDVKLLRACSMLFETNQVDEITFIED